MKRKLLLVLAFIAIPGFASALGLGKLQLNSALNQPFDARIELLSASADEIDSLNVGLADTEAFRRARIDRPFVLSKLRFEIRQDENGPDYIQITSREAIREPFLNFLLESSWSSGRLYREYTVLLDPPLYDPNSSSSSSTDSYYSTSDSASDDSYFSDDVESDSPTQSSTPVVSSYSDSEYGPTTASDTLWSIATQVRPDNSVSVQQMMLALLRANPEAFANGNINGLKRGQILSIPERQEIDSSSSQDAISDVKSQNSSWQETRGILAETVSDRAESVSSIEDSSLDSSDEDSSVMIEDDESELRLVAASSEGAGSNQGTTAGADDSAENLALANEQVEVISQENAELKDRMQEAETIIEDLKRLISLKDDELAALQQQMVAGGEVIAVDEADLMLDTEEEPEVVEEEIAEDLEEDEMLSETETTDDEVISDGDEGLLLDEGQDIDEEVMDEEGILDDEEFLDDEEVLDEEEVIEEEAVVEEQDEIVTETAAPAGMLDQALNFVKGNLIIIAGGLGGLIIVIILLLFISRRKQNAANETSSSPITEFPDFDEEAEIETALPESAGEAEIDASEEETMSPDVAEEEDDEEEGKTEFVAPPAAPAPEPEPEPEPEEPEEDPLAEVNVFLAYEHFDQAEEFVREAIAGSPDNLDFHSKLLEVFYAANDLKSYEEAAQVLHDKVNGEGAHWEMTQAIWQEMSPNRALFEEGGDDVAATTDDTTGGIMDITAEEESDAESTADASVDFDLGMDMGEEPAATEEAESEDVLDITGSGEEDLLDVTAAAGVDGSSSDEDLLDVTAAVGLDSEEFAETVDKIAAEDEPMLDITAGGEEAAPEEDALDISHGGGEDLLDVTANANLEADGLEEDLLDVTSSAVAGADGEELLEIPAEEESADDDNSLDFDIGGMDPEPEVAEEVEAEVPAEEASDDNDLDFDIGGMDPEPEVAEEVEPEVPAEEASDDNDLDFDIGGMDIEPEAAAEEIDAEVSLEGSDDDLNLEIGDVDIEPEAVPEEAEVSLEGSDDDLDLDIGGMDIEPEADEISLDVPGDDSDLNAEDGGIELDLSTGDDLEVAVESEDEISIDDSDDAGDEGLEIDLSIDESDDADSLDIGDLEIDMDDNADAGDLEIDLTLDEDEAADTSAESLDDDLEMDFDLEIDDDVADIPEVDMDGTVEMPAVDMDDMGMDIDDDDDDDDDDSTVFVPRAGAADEQTSEDEIATKLDLAKAYVELGDKDSARGILDEVMADGNDEQKRTAEELIGQLD